MNKKRYHIIEIVLLILGISTATVLISVAVVLFTNFIFNLILKIVQ